MRDFHAFCALREINIFECTPYILNLYLLVLAQKGKSFGTIEAFLSAISFVFKFYLVRDFVQDPRIKDMKRFLAKVIIRKKHLDPPKYDFCGIKLTKMVV